MLRTAVRFLRLLLFTPSELLLLQHSKTGRSGTARRLAVGCVVVTDADSCAFVHRIGLKLNKRNLTRRTKPTPSPPVRGSGPKQPLRQKWNS
jgi:hypothetical protein